GARSRRPAVARPAGCVRDRRTATGSDAVPSLVRVRSRREAGRRARRSRARSWVCPRPGRTRPLSNAHDGRACTRVERDLVLIGADAGDEFQPRRWQLVAAQWQAARAGVAALRMRMPIEKTLHDPVFQRMERDDYEATAAHERARSLLEP